MKPIALLMSACLVSTPAWAVEPEKVNVLRREQPKAPPPAPATVEEELRASAEKPGLSPAEEAGVATLVCGGLTLTALGVVVAFVLLGGVIH